MIAPHLRACARDLLLAMQGTATDDEISTVANHLATRPLPEPTRGPREWHVPGAVAPPVVAVDDDPALMELRRRVVARGVITEEAIAGALGRLRLAEQWGTLVRFEPDDDGVLSALALESTLPGLA